MKWHQWSEKHWDRIWYHVMISPCFYRPKPTTRTHKKSQHVTSLGFAHTEVSIILQFSPVPEFHGWNPTIETSLRTGTIICQTLFLEVQSGQFHFELLQSLQQMTLTSSTSSKQSLDKNRSDWLTVFAMFGKSGSHLDMKIQRRHLEQWNCNVLCPDSMGYHHEEISLVMKHIRTSHSRWRIYNPNGVPLNTDV